MVFEIEGWVYYQIALFTVIIVINMKPIIDGIMPIIKRIILKKKTNN